MGDQIPIQIVYMYMRSEIGDNNCIMDEKNKMENEIIDLQNKLYAIAIIKEQVWTYHPANPNFLNPISLYENLSNEIDEIERKIEILECRLNSLN
jgi:hypothetical protein